MQIIGMVVVVVGSLRSMCSIKDYCSPVLCLGAKQRTPSPSSVAFYDMPGKRISNYYQIRATGLGND